MNLTDVISSAAGILLSLCLSYIPGLNLRWQSIEADKKRLVMLGALIVVSVGVWLTSCYDLTEGVACSKLGAVELVKSFVFALIANQATYSISPGVNTVKRKAAVAKDPS